MLRKILPSILMLLLSSACSMVGAGDYPGFALRFGSDHPKQRNVDGWYQIAVRLPRDTAIERPYVSRARTLRAPLYHQLVDTRRNLPGLPALYCNYVFTFDHEDRLRSVAVGEDSCDQNPL